MRKKAYHSLRRKDGTIVEGPVVVSFRDDGTAAEWHLLQGEEPATEWVGCQFDFPE